MGDKKNAQTIMEFHVVFATAPASRWEVHYGTKRLGYQAWDKRVALSAAKDLAKQHRPSKVVIHNRQGIAESELIYELEQ